MVQWRRQLQRWQRRAKLPTSRIPQVIDVYYKTFHQNELSRSCSCHNWKKKKNTVFTELLIKHIHNYLDKVWYFSFDKTHNRLDFHHSPQVSKIHSTETFSWTCHSRCFQHYMYSFILFRSFNVFTFYICIYRYSYKYSYVSSGIQIHLFILLYVFSCGKHIRLSNNKLNLREYASSILMRQSLKYVNSF